MKHLGGGVVLFPQIVTVPDEIIEELHDMAEDAFNEGYEFTYDENGEIVSGINLSGHTIEKEGLFSDPVRIAGPKVVLNPDFFGKCDTALYQCLLEYFSLFPDAFPCVWWEIAGHVAYYRTGSKYGVHCDNDVNYAYGDFPVDQSALNQVISCSLVLNDNFEGGHMAFKYLDLDVELQKGDALFFPSNYMATHEVTEITSGDRYSYLCNFAQGSPAHDRNIIITDYRQPGLQGKTWLPYLAHDFRKHLENENKPIPLVLERRPDHGRIED